MQQSARKMQVMKNDQNFFLNNCGMARPIEFATSQPTVFYKGSHLGLGGCNVNTDTKLKLGTIQTNPKCRISLQQRPFLTVPFLGRGPPRPVIESRIQQGDYTAETKSCKTVTEKSFEEANDFCVSKGAILFEPKGPSMHLPISFNENIYLSDLRVLFMVRNFLQSKLPVFCIVKNFNHTFFLLGSYIAFTLAFFISL